MTIQQISVFLENKFGRLNEILNLIGKEDIRIFTATVSDTSDFGILRIITDDQEKAYSLLKDNNISVYLNEVFAVYIPSGAGEFAKEIALFTQVGINIEYMYSFSCGEKGILIFRTNNTDAAKEVIRRNDLEIVSENKLKGM